MSPTETPEREPDLAKRFERLLGMRTSLVAQTTLGTCIVEQWQRGRVTGYVIAFDERSPQIEIVCSVTGHVSYIRVNGGMTGTNRLAELLPSFSVTGILDELEKSTLEGAEPMGGEQ